MLKKGIYRHPQASILLMVLLMKYPGNLPGYDHFFCGKRCCSFLRMVLIMQCVHRPGQLFGNHLHMMQFLDR